MFIYIYIYIYICGLLKIQAPKIRIFSVLPNRVCPKKNPDFYVRAKTGFVLKSEDIILPTWNFPKFRRD